MNETKASNLDLKVGDDVDLESKATKVEIGDNFVVIFYELENNDPFYVVICNKPFHRCEETFDGEWGNIWYDPWR
jgi:23S rRNA A1618 N6-methylase RlmF